MSKHTLFFSKIQMINTVLIALFTLSNLLGCEPTTEDEETDEMTCAAQPVCGPNQLEVENCAANAPRCEEVTMCNTSIYCLDLGEQSCNHNGECSAGYYFSSETCSCVYDEWFCEEEPTCPIAYLVANSCEDATSECFETGGDCSYACVYDEWFCEVPPHCPIGFLVESTCEFATTECYETGGDCSHACYRDENFVCQELGCEPSEVQVDFCDVEQEGCYERYPCEEQIYCEVVEIACTGLPSCGEGEVGSLDACLDNGEQCRAETECGQTVYCRPLETAEIQSCESSEPLPMDSFELIEARVEQDELSLTVSYNGGCTLHLFSGCFESFMESAPVQVNIAIGHDAQEDNCRANLTEEHSLSLTALKESYRSAYGQEEGVIILNLNGLAQSLEYRF